MALSTTSGKTTAAAKDPRQPDTTIASEAAARAIVDASPLVADADRVAVVSRNKDGDPDQSVNYRVIGYGDDADDQVKDAAHNKAGEQLGAKHVKDGE